MLLGEVFLGEQVITPDVAAAISAFFAAAAAIANWLQASKAAQSNEVNVYLNMLQDYGSPEMRAAISSLAEFWRLNRQVGVAQAFAKLTESNPDAAKALRGHCRAISAYYVNAARLREGRLISRHLLKLLISHPGLNVFYDVAVPINLHKNPHHNSGRYAKALKAVVPKHGKGIY